MSWFRNLLISIGAFWLSHQPVAFASWLFGKLNEHVIYGDSVAAAIAMGVMTGMGRAVCAAIGAFIVAFFANGEKPYRWGFVVAVLYLVAARPHVHWARTPTTWDRISQATDLLWPVIVCITTASMLGWLRRGKATTQNNTASATSR